jgi:hypothetical protein
MRKVLKSPFKFLDAFEKEDKDLFFGREEEVDYLYDMTFDTRLIVLFGASGTGKTSLIQCGLANKFAKTRWNELYIRREEDITQSILSQLNTALQPYLKNADIKSPVEGLRLLHRYTSKPIFLIYDQFEELFILEPNAEEQQQFFHFLQETLDTPVSCKSILVMREEFIANLWDYEHLVPSLFDNRFRIKKLTEEQMASIVKNTLNVLEARQQLVVEDAEKVSSAILKKLASGSAEVELTYLQVFLDMLFRQANIQEELLPVFNVEAIGQSGTIDDVIDDFLDEQILVLEEQLGEGRKGIPLKILGAMVSNERTKKVLQLQDIEAIRKLHQLSEEEMNICLQAFERMRILNRYES